MVQQYRFWEHPKSGRYYTAYINMDLLGDWVVVCLWGGKGRKPSRTKHIYVTSIKEAMTMIEHIEKRRLARGYVLNTSEQLGIRKFTRAANHGKPKAMVSSPW
jgi:hypothetical protein